MMASFFYRFLFFFLLSFVLPLILVYPRNEDFFSSALCRKKGPFLMIASNFLCTNKNKHHRKCEKKSNIVPSAFSLHMILLYSFPICVCVSGYKCAILLCLKIKIDKNQEEKFLFSHDLKITEQIVHIARFLFLCVCSWFVSLSLLISPSRPTIHLFVSFCFENGISTVGVILKQIWSKK